MKARKNKLQRLKRSGKSIRKNSIRVHEQVVSGSVFAQVPPESQYALLLLGHVFHEISWLQRMLYIAQKNIKWRSQIERDGQALQMMFLTRLMLGKLLEFDTLLRDEKRIDDFVATNFRPESPSEGRAAIDSLRAHFSSNSWIRTARNKHFNHYPVFNDMKAVLDEVGTGTDFRVIHGEKGTHTLYATADGLANCAWLNLADAGDLSGALDAGVKLLLTIARETQELIELALGHYLLGPLARDGDTREQLVPARPLSEQRFDFFSEL